MLSGRLLLQHNLVSKAVVAVGHGYDCELYLLNVIVGTFSTPVRPRICLTTLRECAVSGHVYQLSLTESYSMISDFFFPQPGSWPLLCILGRQGVGY